MRHGRPRGRPMLIRRIGLALARSALLRRASVVLSVVVIIAAGVGTAEAYFTAAGTGTRSASTGSVTLANSAIANCPVTGMLPNATPQSCTFTATYSGPAAAYLAVNVLVETQAGTGGARLYNPADPSGSLQITVTSTSPAVTYAVPASSTTCPGGAPSGSLCYELDNELVATTPFSSAAIALSVAAQVPATSATGYQDGAAQVILTTHAVQSGNNALFCTTTPTAGSPCVASGSFRWS